MVAVKRERRNRDINISEMIQQMDPSFRILTFRIARFIVASLSLRLWSSTGFAAIFSGRGVTFSRPGTRALSAALTA